MFSFRFKSVCIESIGINLPPNEVTSAALEEGISDLYKKLDIPFGTLERMTGVKSRYYWDDTVFPSVVATKAAENCLAQTKIKPSEIGALISCSVARDYFEPATATLVHRNLGLREDTMAMDICNACIGFSNGMSTIATLIESGAIKAGLVVSGETVSRAVNAGMKRLMAIPNLDRDTLLKFLPTVTLGSGSVAYLLCHESISTNKHRYLGTAVRSASQHNELCLGDADYCMGQSDADYQPFMITDAPKLMASAAELGGRAWKDLSEMLAWQPDDLNHIVCHQVGRHVNEAFYRTVGVDRAKEFNIYPTYGNMVSAALPTAFAMAIEGRKIQAGEKVLLMGYGSGLNAMFSGIIW